MLYCTQYNNICLIEFNIIIIIMPNYCLTQNFNKLLVSQFQAPSSYTNYKRTAHDDDQ